MDESATCERGVDHPIVAAHKANTEVANTLFLSGLFGKKTTPQEILAKGMLGQSYGLNMAQAQNQIYTVDGKPSESATLLAALVKKSGKYNYRLKEYTDTEVEVEFLEKVGETWESCGCIKWTMEQAKKVGLAGKDSWKKYPKPMMFHRCMSEGARLFCPDAFFGSIPYNHEELGREPAPEDNKIPDAIFFEKGEDDE